MLLLQLEVRERDSEIKGVFNGQPCGCELLGDVEGEILSGVCEVSSHREGILDLSVQFL